MVRRMAPAKGSRGTASRAGGFRTRCTGAADRRGEASSSSAESPPHPRSAPQLLPLALLLPLLLLPLLL